MKKILAVALALVLTAALAIGGTTALLQDEASAVNVMTLGNVKIQQHEYQRAEGVAHNAGEAGAGNGIQKGDLVPFEQNQPLFPAVPSGELPYTAEPEDLFYWGEYVYSGTAGNGLWNDSKLQNVLDKMVFVENTGRSPAYFRTVLAFECPEGMEYSEGSDKQFMMNTNGSSLYSWETIGYSNFNGTRYLIMVATYSNALAPGNTAHPSLLQVVMTHHVTNADCEKLGETYEILALSQAVQTEGFASAESALNAAFGKPAEMAGEWLGGVIEEHSYEEEIDPALTVLTIDNFDEFKAFDAAVDNNGEYKGVKVANNASVYVKLNTDIDLSSYSGFTGIGNGNGNSFDGVFNGYGHTIKNWTVASNWQYYCAFFRTTANLTVKHLTFENFNLGTATTKGTNYGVVIGAVGGSDVIIEDVTVNNCTVKAQRTVGGIVGGITNGSITFRDCTVENVTLYNAGNDPDNNRVAGSLLGNGWSHHDAASDGIYTENNTVTNVAWIAGGVEQSTVPLYTYNK